MKLIIAGSRSVTKAQFDLAVHGVNLHAIQIDEVVSGKCPEGADYWGEQWAKAWGIPVKLFPADWDNVTAPGAVVKYRRDGKAYNALAGFWRNQQMADYGDMLFAIWDGRSNGTKDMIRRMGQKPVLLHTVR